MDTSGAGLGRLEINAGVGYLAVKKGIEEMGSLSNVARTDVSVHRYKTYDTTDTSRCIT